VVAQVEVVVADRQVAGERPCLARCRLLVLPQLDVLLGHLSAHLHLIAQLPFQLRPFAFLVLKQLKLALPSDQLLFKEAIVLGLGPGQTSLKFGELQRDLAAYCSVLTGLDITASQSLIEGIARVSHEWLGAVSGG